MANVTIDSLPTVDSIESLSDNTLLVGMNNNTTVQITLGQVKNYISEAIANTGDSGDEGEDESILNPQEEQTEPEENTGEEEGE